MRQYELVSAEHKISYVALHSSNESISSCRLCWITLLVSNYELKVTLTLLWWHVVVCYCICMLSGMVNVEGCEMSEVGLVARMNNHKYDAMISKKIVRKWQRNVVRLQELWYCSLSCAMFWDVSHQVTVLKVTVMHALFLDILSVFCVVTLNEITGFQLQYCNRIEWLTASQQIAAAMLLLAPSVHSQDGMSHFRD